MKDDKDIIIDGLMARIRELEKQVSCSEKTNNSTKGTRSKALFSDTYIELDYIDDIFNKSIDELYTSVRIRNCLMAENILYIGQLVACTENELLRTPNLAKKSVGEIQDTLKEFGLRLGMTKQDKLDFKSE